MTRQRRYSLGARLAAAFAMAGLAVLAMLGGYLYQALSTQLRQRDEIEIADKLKQVTQLTSAARTLAGVRLAAPAFHETLLSHSGLFVGSSTRAAPPSSSIRRKPDSRWVPASLRAIGQASPMPARRPASARPNASTAPCRSVTATGSRSPSRAAPTIAAPCRAPIDWISSPPP